VLTRFIAVSLFEVTATLTVLAGREQRIELRPFCKGKAIGRRAYVGNQIRLSLKRPATRMPYFKGDSGSWGRKRLLPSIVQQIWSH
jgi:hypothetical protein